jgi:hypothetical protein
LREEGYRPHDVHGGCRKYEGGSPNTIAMTLAFLLIQPDSNMMTRQLGKVLRSRGLRRRLYGLWGRIAAVHALGIRCGGLDMMGSK